MDYLLYELQQGPLEEILIRRAQAEHRPIPKAIAEAPQLMPGLGFYYNAFLALCSCRQVGMGEGRIPWTSAHEYARRMGMDEEEFEDLWMLVCLMDGAYLKYRAEKSARDNPKR